MPTDKNAWVLVGQFTPTIVNPEIDAGEWRAVGFPTRQDAEHWLHEDGRDLWWLDAMILPVGQP